MPSTDSLSDSDAQLTAELAEEVRLARQFFSRVERMSTLSAGYPAGHPVIEQSVQHTYDALAEYFELDDRLTVQVDAHQMLLSGTEEVVWETGDPKDYCFALSRDGVFLIHLLAGLQQAELRRFVETLNTLVDPTDMMTEAVTLLFEANFSYIAYEALDASLAALAGLDVDIRDRDTAEERDMIEEIFDDAFDHIDRESTDATTMDQQFQIKMEVRNQRHHKLQVGSRHFLTLDNPTQQHLLALKGGFREHRELEHREGEMLSALLGANPKPALRRESIRQIGEVIGSLVETDAPWEGLSFLRLIHAWRDRFDPQVADELKAIVRDCFTQKRINALVKKITTGDRDQRRSILQMFDALHLRKAAANLVGILGWELDEDVREDIVSYIRKQAGADLDLLAEAVHQVDDDQVDVVVDILIDHMPRARPILVDLLDDDYPTPIKTHILAALAGTWDDSRQIRDALVPFLESSDPQLQLEAIRNFTRAAPQHVPRVMGPLIDSRLKERPDSQVREIVTLFVEHGGRAAIDHLESLIRQRGVVSTAKQELAVVIVRALVNSRHPHVIDLLEDVSKDWLVPKRIRHSAREVIDLLTG